jgi:hypothetical protein
MVATDAPVLQSQVVYGLSSYLRVPASSLIVVLS